MGTISFKYIIPIFILLFTSGLSAQTVSLSSAQCGHTIQYGDPIFSTENDSATEYEFKFFTRRDTVVLSAHRNYLLVDEYRNRIRTHVNFNVVIRCKFENGWGQYGDTCSSLIYLDGFEEMLAKYGRSGLSSNTPCIDLRNYESEGEYYIPVVFHVLVPSTYTESAELTDYLPPEKIYETLQILNDVFSGATAQEEDGPRVDTEIRFCIAKKDIYGTELSVSHNGQQYFGITYYKDEDNHINGQGLEMPSEDVHPIRDPRLRHYSRFPRDKYLNIFISEHMDIPNTAGKAWSEFFGQNCIGYVNLAKQFIGTNNSPNRSLGYSLAHEVGHFLGLLHTWHYYIPDDNDDENEDETEGEEHVDEDEMLSYGCHCNPNDDDNYDNCVTDYVYDTPCHLSASTYCDYNINEPIHNIMNYTPDGCRRVFTEGQKRRMRCVIEHVDLYQELVSSDVETICSESLPPSIYATQILSPTDYWACPNVYNTIDVKLSDDRLFRKLEVYINSNLESTYTYNDVLTAGYINGNNISIPYYFSREGFYRIKVYSGYYDEINGEILDTHTHESTWNIISHSMRVSACNGFSGNTNQAQWYFDRYVSLDFRSGIARLQEGSEMAAEASESSICDDTGSLLFYTDGRNVWNSEHRRLNLLDMPDDDISSKGTIILKFSNTKYAILSTTIEGDLKCRVITISGNTINAEDLTTIYHDFIGSKISSITAVPAMEEGMYWLLSATTGSYVKPVVMKVKLTNDERAIEISQTNIQIFSNIQIRCDAREPYVYSINVSPTSEYVVYSAAGGLKFLRFNANTGELFDYNCNYGVIKKSDVAFSPSGRFLYVAGLETQHIVQYDLQNVSECGCPDNYITIFNPNDNIIGDYNLNEYNQELGGITTSDYESEFGTLPNALGNYMQEGPDGRIYFSVVADYPSMSRSLGVIKNPEVLAPTDYNNECGITYPCIRYEAGSQYYNRENLPNFVDAINIDTCKVKFIVCSHNCSDIKIENMSLGLAEYQWTFRDAYDNILLTSNNYNLTEQEIEDLTNTLTTNGINSFIVRLEKLNSPNAPACENAYMEQTIPFRSYTFSITGSPYICNNGSPATFSITPADSHVSAIWSSSLNEEQTYSGLEYTIEYEDDMPESFIITTSAIDNLRECPGLATQQVNVIRLNPTVIVERDCNSYPLTYTITIGNVTDAWAKIQSMEDFSWVSDDENNTITIYISNIQIENQPSEHSIAYLSNLGVTPIVLPISVFDNISGCEYVLEANLFATPVAQQLEVSCDEENPHSIFVIHNVEDEHDIRVETNLDGHFVEGYDDISVLVYQVEASSCGELNGNIVSIYYENGSENTECLLYMGSAGQTEPLTVTPTQIKDINFNCASQIVYPLSINIIGGLPPYTVLVEEEGGIIQSFTLDHQGENIINIQINPSISGGHEISFTVISHNQQYTWTDYVSTINFNENLLNTLIEENHPLINDGTYYVAPQSPNLTFDHDVTFTNCTIYCAYTDYNDIANTQWIVNSGNTVTFENCTIMAACPDKMWQGIVVNGNEFAAQSATTHATVDIKQNTIIADAMIAVKSENGGIVKANNSKFINNRYDIHFGKYDYKHTKTVIRGNKFLTLDGGLNNPNYYPQAHIYMNQVDGITIRSNTFRSENMDADISKWGIGVESSLSGFTLSPRYLTITDPVPVEPRDTFENLYYGVKASGKGTTAPAIKHNVFTNNFRGVYINNADGSRVLFNNFTGIYDRIYPWQVVFTRAINRPIAIHYLDSYSEPYSVYINNSKSSYCEENTITRCEIGAYMNNSGDGMPSRMYRNKFGRQPEVGRSSDIDGATMILGTNSDSRTQSVPGYNGLEVRCNEYIGTGSAIDVKGNMRLSQGSSNKPAGNKFHSSFINGMEFNAPNTRENYTYYQTVNATNEIFHTELERYYGTGIRYAGNYDEKNCKSNYGTTIIYDDHLERIDFQGKEVARLKSTYDSIVDRGNTDAMLSQASSVSLFNMVIPFVALCNDGYLSDTVYSTLIANTNSPSAFTAAVLIANSPLPQSVRKMVEDSDLPSIYKSLVGYCQTGINSRDRLQSNIDDGKQEIAVLESEMFHEALNNDTIVAVKDTVLTYLRGKSDHNYNDAINEYKLLLSKKDYAAVRDALKSIYGMSSGMDSDLRDELTNFCSVNNIYVDYLTATSEAEAAKILDGNSATLLSAVNDSSPLYSGLAEILYERFADGVFLEYTPLPEMAISNKSMIVSEEPDATLFAPYIAIYPNPTDGMVFVEYNFEYSKESGIEFLLEVLGKPHDENCNIGTLNLYSSDSKILHTMQMVQCAGMSVIDLSNYPAGTYIIEVLDCIGNATSVKVVRF